MAADAPQAGQPNGDQAQATGDAAEPQKADPVGDASPADPKQPVAGDPQQPEAGDPAAPDDPKDGGETNDVAVEELPDGTIRIDDPVPGIESHNHDKMMLDELNNNHGHLNSTGHAHHHLTGSAVTTFFFTIFASQIILYVWKKRHAKSFFAVTLLGLWLFPFFSILPLFWWRFLLTWILVTSALLYLMWKATRKPLGPETPRLVYSFFFWVHKATSIMSVTGYFIIVIEIMGLGLIIGMKLADFGLILLCYGLYFGVLSRDWATVCSDSISASIGYYSKRGIPRRQCRVSVCAICDKDLFPRQQRRLKPASERTQDKTFKMQCGHIAHDFCIRGWVMIGKVDTCPVCKEKVNISDLFVSPWQKTDRAWAQLLDAIRYLVVWNPIIVMIGRFLIYEMGIPMLTEHVVGTNVRHHPHRHHT